MHSKLSMNMKSMLLTSMAVQYSARTKKNLQPFDLNDIEEYKLIKSKKSKLSSSKRAEIVHFFEGDKLGVISDE